MISAGEESICIQEAEPARAPLELLLEADPSLERVRSYLRGAKCLIATIQSAVIGVCVLSPTSSDRFELMNIAVVDRYRGKGIGTKLLLRAIDVARAAGATLIAVGTGTFGYQLVFYQRLGFRVVAVERDFFLRNYDEPVFENGIQHKDMLRLHLALGAEPG